jgi:hypothetical protein
MDHAGPMRSNLFIPLVPAQAGTQQLDSRLRGNERRWNSDGLKA